MGVDRFRFEYDPVVALNNAPKLMGMDLHRHGGELEGQYYLNGDRHMSRKEKLKVFIGRGCVWVKEEGGRCVSLPQWLVEFGGAVDFKDAIRRINGQPHKVDWQREVRERAPKEAKYVSKDVLEGASQYDLTKCPLFRWMCGMFKEEKVREVWKMYNVTTDAHGNAVYWYVDEKGRILYDKRIAYGEDGHRDKGYFPGRQYRVADGYTGRCYFGACLPDDGRKAFICESEKTALVATLYYGRRFYATGGKGNLRDVEGNVALVPDYDARDEWSGRGEIWPWWEKWHIAEIPEHADLGDMIEWKLKNE